LSQKSAIRPYTGPIEFSYTSGFQTVGHALLRGAQIVVKGHGTFWELHSTTELIAILKMSEINFLILCIAFRNTTLAATGLLLSIKSFVPSLHLLHGLKSNITTRLHLPAGPQQHSLSLHIHLQPYYSTEYCCNTLLYWFNVKFLGTKPFLVIC